MSDIARLAGVSEATVSRSLKDSPLINEKTRKRVQDIAREHNYKINAAARNFRLKKTHTLAVVLLVDREWGHEVSDAFLMVLLGSIADEAANQGYDLLLSTNPHDVADLGAYYLESKRADGLIIIGQGRNDPRLDRLAASKAPFIVWGAEVEDHDYFTVGSDNRQGGYDATKLLIENGRKHIAFLGDIRHPEMEHRWEGYRRALEEAGIPYDESLVIPTDFSRSDGYEKADKVLLGEHRECDAVFCVSDNIALGVMKRLSEAGIRVPEDIAIVGFDDNPLAVFSTPGLTTIKQDIREGGKLLVQNLVKVLNGEAIGHVTMPTELIVRQSCGRG
ncbi:LacI family DNA-binding transcriptional regulator [Kordiimonas marina]|uniref:LacI family DNA-binding transcriptional regulator n=1 Tax=Kordiimonas marina TaxID=2872312 RepID=UPI001FF3A2A7|nr:LacI family DNA-binding transcriptional regulator [Kordiimonas marina]MCJ9430674.1 LacI family transcriptional regulator [Kordiimonas marina]